MLPSIFRNMKRPSQFPTVVKYSFLIMIVTYTLLSTMGYIAYTDEVNSNILLNIAESGTSQAQHVVSIVLTTTVMVTVATKYALASVPITESLYEWSRTVFYAYYERVEAAKRHVRGASPEFVATYTEITDQLHGLPSTSPCPFYQSESAEDIEVQQQKLAFSQDSYQNRLLTSRLFASQDTVEEEEEKGGGAVGPTLKTTSVTELISPPPGKMPAPFSLLIEEEQEQLLAGEEA